jgi:hypothetical protein
VLNHEVHAQYTSMQAGIRTTDKRRLFPLSTIPPASSYPPSQPPNPLPPPHTLDTFPQPILSSIFQHSASVLRLPDPPYLQLRPRPAPTISRRVVFVFAGGGITCSYYSSVRNCYIPTFSITMYTLSRSRTNPQMGVGPRLVAGV